MSKILIFCLLRLFLLFKRVFFEAMSTFLSTEINWFNEVRVYI